MARACHGRHSQTAVHYDGNGRRHRRVRALQFRVQYFVSDPKGKDAAWRTTNALTCYTGTGTNGGVRSVPHFSVLTSQGFDDTATVVVNCANRSLEATYTFQLTTRKVSGGMIMDTSSAFCFVATPATRRPPTSATSSRVTRLCHADGLELVELARRLHDSPQFHTDSGRHGIPLCLSGRTRRRRTATAMTLAKCATTSDDPNGQRWTWTGDYTWQGQNAANTDLRQDLHREPRRVSNAGDLLSVSTTDVHLQLAHANGCRGQGQRVLCHEASGQPELLWSLPRRHEREYHYSYMIAYPCKQDPSGAGHFDWNHKWTYAEPRGGCPTPSPPRSTVNNGIEVLPDHRPQHGPHRSAWGRDTRRRLDPLSTFTTPGSSTSGERDRTARAQRPRGRATASTPTSKCVHVRRQQQPVPVAGGPKITQDTAPSRGPRSSWPPATAPITRSGMCRKPLLRDRSAAIRK